MTFAPLRPATSVSSNAPTRLLVIDDHPVFRHGVVQLLSTMPELTVCGEAANSQEALEAMRRLRPTVAMVDISMPGTNGIELTKLMLAEEPRLIVLVVSMHDESLYALRALRAGAKGYVTKQQAVHQLIEALKRVVAGGLYVSPQFADRLIFKAIWGAESDLGVPIENLSDRELEVLQLFGRAYSTREVAERLHLSVKTIETHRAHIKDKLGLPNSDELVRFATEWVVASEQ